MIGYQKNWPSFFSKWLILSVILLGGCKSFELDSNPSLDSVLLEEGPKIESTFNESKLLLSSARKFERAGQLEESIKLYEKVATGKSKESTNEANRHLAVLYDLTDQRAKAKKAFLSAMKDGNPDADLANDFGYFLLKNNEIDNALQVLSQARQRYPENERLTTNLGIALVSAGRIQEGFQLFESTLGSVDAASNVGAVLTQLGKFDEAQKWLQQAASSSGNQSVAGSILRMANRN